MECREVREYLPAYAEQAGDPRASYVDEHLVRCGDCRAELEQYREMAGALKALTTEVTEPPSWLLGTLNETVGERAERIAAIRSKRDQITDPKLVAGGAILAAGLAGALLMRGRRRRRRTLREKVREALAEA